MRKRKEIIKMINFNETIELIEKQEGFLDEKHLRNRLFGKILQMQYYFYHKFLANKYLNKLLLHKDFSVNPTEKINMKKISNHYYGTLYTYTNIALLDEVQEIKEKINKRDFTIETIDDITEEFIDAFHFITQHLVLQLEHSYLPPDQINCIFHDESSPQTVLAGLRRHCETAPGPSNTKWFFRRPIRYT